MNAVLASRQHHGPRDANEARALHLISVVEGQLTKAKAAVLANEPRQIVDAMLTADRNFNELLDRTVLAVSP